MVEVLVCHWGEDLTGHNLVKELFLFSVKESRVIPMESSYENEMLLFVVSLNILST